VEVEKLYFVILYWYWHSPYWNSIPYTFHIRWFIFTIESHFRSYLY